MGLLRELWAILSDPPEPAGIWMIKHGGKFWDGTRFTKEKSEAVTFHTTSEAWDYVEFRFEEEIADRCDLFPKVHTRP